MLAMKEETADPNILTYWLSRLDSSFFMVAIL